MPLALSDTLCSFAGFLTNLIGFVLPAYFSMRALETPHPQDDVQWCVCRVHGTAEGPC